MRDPQVVDLTEEKEVEVPVPEGPCLICGRWIEGEEADVYAVKLRRASGGTGDFVSHVSCLADAADPSAKLP